MYVSVKDEELHAVFAEIWALRTLMGAGGLVPAQEVSVVLCLTDHSESGDSILLFTLYDFELMLMLVEAADDTYSFSLFVYLIFGFSIHIQSCFIVLFNAHSFLIYRSCGLLRVRIGVGDC